MRAADVIIIVVYMAVLVSVGVRFLPATAYASKDGNIGFRVVQAPLSYLDDHFPAFVLCRPTNAGCPTSAHCSGS